MVVEEGIGTPAGVGRIIRYPDRPDAADVSVTVLDEYQGRGAASALLAELIRRRPEGVTRIVTSVAADNAPSLALIRQLGPVTATDPDPSRLDVEVALEDSPSAASSTDF